MTLGGYVTHVNALVDQWFVHEIRPDFLSFHVMILSLGLVCATVGRVLSQASLAVAGSERSDRPLNTALTLAVFIALASVPVLWGVRSQLFPGSLFQARVFSLYYLVYCLIFAIDIVKAPLTMILVRAGGQRRLARLPRSL